MCCYQILGIAKCILGLTDCGVFIWDIIDVGESPEIRLKLIAQVAAVVASMLAAVVVLIDHFKQGRPIPRFVIVSWWVGLAVLHFCDLLSSISRSTQDGHLKIVPLTHICIHFASETCLIVANTLHVRDVLWPWEYPKNIRSHSNPGVTCDDSRGGGGGGGYDSRPSPRNRTSLCMRHTFFWVWPLLRRATSKQGISFEVFTLSTPDFVSDL